MFLNVAGHSAMAAVGIDLRVEFNGVDVTRRCVNADDEAGFATLARPDMPGCPTFVEYGRVRILCALTHARPWSRE